MDDFGVCFFAEPSVVVDAEVAVKAMLDRPASSHGRL
jgi:hypothetical protein